MEAVRLIAQQNLKAEICSAARGTKGDIDAVAKSNANSIHLIIPTSDLHLKYKIKKTREEILKITEERVEQAKKQGLIVELSAEDATRTDINFLKEVFVKGIAAGADRVVACDTVGILTPEKAFDSFSTQESHLKFQS